VGVGGGPGEAAGVGGCAGTDPVAGADDEAEGVAADEARGLP
jgi:hypothetical protein